MHAMGKVKIELKSKIIDDMAHIVAGLRQKVVKMDRTCLLPKIFKTLVRMGVSKTCFSGTYFFHYGFV